MPYDINAALQGMPSGLDILKAYQTGAAVGQQYQDKNETDQIGKLASTGDLEGAQKLALSSNHLDYVDKIDALQTFQRTKAQQGLELTARIANAVKTASPDPTVRKQLATTQYSGLLQQMGYSPQQLAGADYSDAGLDSIINSALSLKDQMELNKPIDMAPGHTAITRDGKEVYKAAPELKLATDPVTGRSAFGNPQTGLFGRAAVQGAPSSGTAATGTAMPPAATAATGDNAPAGDAGFTNAINTVLHNEGSAFVAHDGNGAPVRFGINQGANPDVNVATLTRDQAVQLYKSRYWDKSQAPNLPANMQTPYFDVYVRNPKVADRALAQSNGDPAQFMQIATGYFNRLAQSPKFAKYANAWSNRDANNTAIATGGASTGTTDAPAQTDDPYTFGGAAPFRYLNPAEKKAAGYAPDSVVVRDPKGNDTVKQKGEAPTDGGGQLTDGAVESLATQVAMGGKLPSLGMGKPATAMRARILNRAAELVGGAVNQENVARFRSLNNSLTKVQQQLDAVGSAEKGVILNAEGPLLQAARQDIPTGSPLLNQPINYVRGKLGSVKPGDLETAIQGVANEYAKVMTGASGGSPISDAARSHALALFNTNMSYSQIVTNVNRLKQEMTNRVAGLSTQRAQILAQIHGMDAHKGVPATAAAPHAQVNIPQEAIATLKGNPTPQMRAHFDEVFGAGAAAKVIGH